MTDRGNSNAPNAGNYDTNVSVPDVGNPATLFAAEQYAQCPQPVLPLTYDWTALKNLVDSLYPAGNTNQGIGIAHGWMSLVGGGPYPAPPAEEPELQVHQSHHPDERRLEHRKPLVLPTRTRSMRAEAMTCANAKAAGITSSTRCRSTPAAIRLQTVLKNCASPGKYPDASKFIQVKRPTSG